MPKKTGILRKACLNEALNLTTKITERIADYNFP